MRNKYKGKVEITARAVVVVKNNFLVCKCKNKDYFFFPGGHIYFGEKAKDALNRELKEELGRTFKKWFFIGAVENIYKEDGCDHHEIILAFAAKTTTLKLKSKEGYLKFFLKTKKELLKEKIFPKALAKAIINWQKNKKLFFSTQTINT